MSKKSNKQEGTKMEETKQKGGEDYQNKKYLDNQEWEIRYGSYDLQPLGGIILFIVLMFVGCSIFFIG